MLPVVTEILKQDMSINLYMFHGGTNFGFLNGALAEGVPAPKPMVTSYGMCNESFLCSYTAHMPDISNIWVKKILCKNIEEN